MKKDWPILRMAAVALAAGLVLAPSAGLADQFHGRPASGGRPGGSGVVGRPFGPSRMGPHQFPGHRFGHHHRRHFGPFWPTVLYAPPLYYGAYGAYGATAFYDPPVSYDPPVVYSPPPVYAPQMSGIVSVAPAPPPPPAPPTPNVIEYPTGRYELRGDGVTMAYTWVWIPNPPPPPPAAPPAQPVVPSGSPSGEQPAPRRSQLYRWTDEQDVTHFTDRWEVVPDEYRNQTKRLPPT